MPRKVKAKKKVKNRYLNDPRPRCPKCGKLKPLAEGNMRHTDVPGVLHVPFECSSKICNNAFFLFFQRVAPPDGISLKDSIVCIDEDGWPW